MKKKRPWKRAERIELSMLIITTLLLLLGVIELLRLERPQLSQPVTIIIQIPLGWLPKISQSKFEEHQGNMLMLLVPVAGKRSAEMGEVALAAGPSKAPSPRAASDGGQRESACGVVTPLPHPMLLPMLAA